MRWIFAANSSADDMAISCESLSERPRRRVAQCRVEMGREREIHGQHNAANRSRWRWVWAWWERELSEIAAQEIWWFWICVWRKKNEKVIISRNMSVNNNNNCSYESHDCLTWSPLIASAWSNSSSKAAHETKTFRLLISQWISTRHLHSWYSIWCEIITMLGLSWSTSGKSGIIYRIAENLLTDKTDTTRRQNTCVTASRETNDFLALKCW